MSILKYFRNNDTTGAKFPVGSDVIFLSTISSLTPNRIYRVVHIDSVHDHDIDRRNYFYGLAWKDHPTVTVHFRVKESALALTDRHNIKLNPIISPTRIPTFVTKPVSTSVLTEEQLTTFVSAEGKPVEVPRNIQEIVRDKLNRDYSKYPPTLGDARSDRTEKGGDWTPREALIELLRKIDTGLIKPTELLVLYINDNKYDDMYFTNACKSDLISLGMCGRFVRNN